MNQIRQQPTNQKWQQHTAQSIHKQCQTDNHSQSDYQPNNFIKSIFHNPKIFTAKYTLSRGIRSKNFPNLNIGYSILQATLSLPSQIHPHSVYSHFPYPKNTICKDTQKLQSTQHKTKLKHKKYHFCIIFAFFTIQRQSDIKIRRSVILLLR